MADTTWIGASYERGDGFEKASGLAVYRTDVILQGMIHAKILHIDVDRAKNL